MPQPRIPSHEASTRSTDFASPAELLSKLSIFWFSLLSPKEQQDKIEQISNKLAAEDVNVGSLAAAAGGETKEDVRRKAFAMLFNKAPVVTRVDLFKEFTKKFFVERRLCEGILLSRQLGSNEQQEEIDEIKQSRYAEFYLGLSIIWFKARCASDPRNLIQVVVGKAGVDDDIFEKLVNETEEDFKLRRFTESFKQLQFSSQEDIVEFIQDAVFRDLVDDVSNTFKMREDVSNTGDSVSGNVAGIRRNIIYAGDSVSRLHADVPGVDLSGYTSSAVGIHNFGNTTSSRPFWERLLEFFKMSTGLVCAGVRQKINKIKFCGGSDQKIKNKKIICYQKGGTREDVSNSCSLVSASRIPCSVPLNKSPFREPLQEFIKISIPDLKGPRGATATQGGEQGAITQGGQGTSQQ